MVIHRERGSGDPVVQRRRAARKIFNDVQRVFAENLPVLYFAAPRIYYAHNSRVLGVVPSVQRPPALWNADMLAVQGRP